MLVLHTHWYPPTNPHESGQLLVWAETSNKSQPKGQRRSKSVKTHPFSADLLEILRHLGSLDENQTRTSSVTLLLPTTKYGPQPSPQLLHEWELDDPKPPTLNRWQMRAICLPLADACHLLMSLANEQALPTGVVLGDDCRYWQVALRLGLEALAQQKILPTLAQAGADYHARWLPILDGTQDGPRVAHLLAAMPPLCRAAVDTPAAAPPPRRLLDTFLNAMTDTLTRQWGRAKLPAYLHSKEPTHAWLKALFQPQPTVNGNRSQLRQVHRNYKTWLRNLHIAGDKVFRVAFRLEAPIQRADSKSKRWLLHFLLQAREDPSLLIPASQVWETKGNMLETLNQQFKQPQEKLLTGLGFAARLFEPIRQGLKTAQPTEVVLTSNQAYHFMRESAPLLESSGFGVLVPPWWDKPGTRLGVRLQMSSDKSASMENTDQARMTFDKLVRYRWELSIGETRLNREEFEALVALKSPLVEVRGQWVQLDPEQIEAAIRFWEKHTLEGDVDLHEGLRMGLGAEDEIEGLSVEGVVFDGWLKEWMERLNGDEKLDELAQPLGLGSKLRPYQQYGFSWLHFLRQWGLGACLADDMGLGKTIQTIALLQHDKERNQLSGPTLLICPTSVVSNWQREVAKFAPELTTLMHQGPNRLRDQAFLKQATQVDMVLTSYPLVRRDVETLKQIKWYGVILDEAQNIKNAETKQSRAVRQMSGQFRLTLTGTPVENRLSELWSIMNFLNPGYLGSRDTFRKKFAIPIETLQDEGTTERLKQLVRPFILRRVKTDPSVIQDLPDKMEMKIYCNLSQEQATLYEAVVQDSMRRINEASGIERRGIVLSMLMKLKQICNHPAQFLHEYDGKERQFDVARETSRSDKLARLTEMLEESVAVGDKCLIFTQFAEMGHFLRTHLQQALGVATLFLHGGTPAKKRTQMVEQFQTDSDGPPIFVLSLKAGGTGLNLTQANHVFHFDRWWNPAVEDQATDRAFRIGQTRNVQVHKFVCVGTLEEMIDDMIESKKALAESVIGSGENWLTEMSTDDLRELVILRKGAVK